MHGTGLSKNRRSRYGSRKSVTTRNQDRCGSRHTQGLTRCKRVRRVRNRGRWGRRGVGRETGKRIDYRWDGTSKRSTTLKETRDKGVPPDPLGSQTRVSSMVYTYRGPRDGETWALRIREWTEGTIRDTGTYVTPCGRKDFQTVQRVTHDSFVVPNGLYPLY